MKSCQSHWEELRAAIKNKGLEHLVSNDGKQAVNRIAKELKDDQLVITDPLMNSWFAIMNNALSNGGIYLLNLDENGNHYCPLCELEKHTEVKASEWIEYASEEQKQIAIKKGLINKN